MASTYLRPTSPFIWISCKDATGKWKNAKTGYRQDNIGDRKQGALLAKQKSLEEMENKPARVPSHKWEDWVLPWINSRWGNRTNRTPKMYANYFWTWLKYFKENKILLLFIGGQRFFLCRPRAQLRLQVTRRSALTKFEAVSILLFCSGESSIWTRAGLMLRQARLN